MKLEAKLELAKAILDTMRIRNEAYVKNSAVEYYAPKFTRTWEECMAEAGVDPDLQRLVYAMCVTGYCDYPDWAEKMIKQAESI